jgi:hypothetical protein
MRGMAQLQSEFGRDIAGILTGKAGEIPDFGAILRIVEVALAKGNPSLSAEQVKELADDMATPDLVEAIVKAAFPDAEGDAGNGQRAGKPKG